MALVTFTGAKDKTSIAIQHNLVMLVGKSQGGIITSVQTGIMTPGGPITLEVMESVEEVVELVAAAAGRAVAPTASKPASVLES